MVRYIGKVNGTGMISNLAECGRLIPRVRDVGFRRSFSNKGRSCGRVDSTHVRLSAPVVAHNYRLGPLLVSSEGKVNEKERRRPGEVVDSGKAARQLYKAGNGKEMWESGVGNFKWCINRYMIAAFRRSFPELQFWFRGEPLLRVRITGP